MRVLVVGLGDIARKAYLPVLAAMPGIELHLATRNAATLADLGEAYRIPHLYRSASEALAAHRFDAAFVHAATEAHSDLVHLLLGAGVPVLVDKPLAYSFDEASRLVSLSEKARCLLMVGFNRRYAPDYAALREVPRDFCLMQKHRYGHLDEPRRVVFDDFIHVIDTLLFLSPTPERTSIETVVSDGLLHSATVVLRSKGHLAIGTMHRNSGLDEERLDVIGDGQKHSVLNLSEQRVQSEGKEAVARRPDWASAARQRGFDTMCSDFLRRVRDGDTTASQHILQTHLMCEEVVRHAESALEA